MGEHLTIAVVDDQMTARMLIGRILERTFADREVSVLEGSNGGDAIALRFGDPTPALLIVNWVMPGMDGMAAIAEIRRREAAENLPRVPIVFESGYIPDAPVPGADATLSCPFSRQDLIAVVEPFIGPPPPASVPAP